MALQIYYDKDADLKRIQGKKVAIIGYGSQGHAHAQNLHHSGVDVVVGLRKDSPTWAKAESAGLKVATVAEATRKSDVIMLTLPDELAAGIYKSEIAPNLAAGNYLAVAHGFNIHFQAIVPPKDINVIMIAPKGPGHTVRDHYEQGRGVPCLVAVHQNPSGDSSSRVGYARRSAAAGRHRDFPRGDRDRSLRRAGRALRRAHRADAGRLRDARRSGLRAGDGVLRVHPRSEADRGPDLRRRRREHALFGVEHRGVR
jgi:ketol-acid reductoisomerase